MLTLSVPLGTRTYPIYIGPGLLGQSIHYHRHIPASQVMVITNETVAPYYLDKVQSALAEKEVRVLVLPDGEEYKTLETLNLIIEALLQNHFNRRCTLVALGGGVIGDLVGFAAACYQRGVAFLQIPTTLLAQVDSSVGGKTGVNHPLGKNMIGAFHQPSCVIADILTLNTLPDRQLSAGLAEVIKYGLIGDKPFFHWLETHIHALLQRDPEALIYAIERSCRDKAKVVAADERESGQRALLNLGHTFGHAIETGLGYGVWLHGEAVAAGICMAARLSVKQGWLPPDDETRIRNLMSVARLPITPPPELTEVKLMELMSVDKKILSGRLRLVLLKAIGEGLVTEDFDGHHLWATIEGQ